MFRVTIAGLRATKRRLVGTALAVLLGVAFLTGTLALGDTLSANFDRLFADANAGTDVVVRSSSVIKATGNAGPDEQTRAPIDAALVDRIRAVDGVAAAVPSITGYGQLLGRDGKPVGGNGPPRTAGNWVTEPALNPYRLVEGRAPRASGEVVVNRGAAQDGHLSVGDTTVVQTPDPVPVRVVGIATFGDADGMGRVTFVGFALADAQAHLTNDPGKVSSVLVKADPGVSQSALADRVHDVVPSGVQAITGARLTQENTDDIASEFLSMFRALLVVFAGIALLVATFSTFNTFSILLAQRARDSALLRAIGATRRQVVGAVLAETVVVGVVASIVGLAAGIGLAGLLKGLFDAIGFSLPAGGLVLHTSTVVASLLVGVGATVLAGAVPAVRASRVPPIAALRDVAVDRSAASRGRLVTGVVLAALGVGLVIAGVAGGSLGPVGIGAAVTVVAFVVLGPVVARPAAAVLGWPFRVRGVTGALAVRNATRNPRRTAASATALVVGVGVVVLFTVFAASIKASIDRSVSRSFGGDLVVSSPSFGGGGLSPAVGQAVGALPEVSTAAGVGKAAANVDGRGRLVTITDPAAVDRVLDVDVASGSLGGGGVAVSTGLARRSGWRLGTPVTIGFPDGTSARLSVNALFRDTDVVGSVVVPRVVWAPHAPQATDEIVLVELRNGVSLDTGTTAVERATAPYGGPDVLDRSGYADQAATGVDLFLGVVYALLALAVLIALMGIANTLSLSVHERTRELGLLRAVGETRRQVRSMVRAESVLVALFGTIGGSMLGLFLGWALVTAAGSDTAVFAVPVGRLVAVLVVGAVAGVVAGLRPARRAARLDVLEAIASP